MIGPYEKTDVVIVGGGLAGLSAACYLAQDGRRVTLFEKASHLGGRAATTVYDGYAFNRGIHALYCGGATEQVLQELGIRYSAHPPKQVLVMDQGCFFPFPTDPFVLLTSRLFRLSEKVELLSVFAKLPTMKPEMLAHVSVQDWLESTFHTPRLRQFMTSFACTNVYSTALDLVSAQVLVQKLQLAIKHPTLYLDGGWQTLIDGLHTAAVKAGTTIISGMRVQTVDYEQERVQGVHLADGTKVRAAAVILAVSPRDALALVEHGTYPALQHIVEGLLPARVACLDVALSRLPDPRHAIVQDMARPRFFSTQSLYAHVAPEGGALISAFEQLDATQQQRPHEAERSLEDLLDCAQPGWREVLVKRVFLPHIEAVGALPTAPKGGYASRPGPQVPGIANLYLAGDWIGEGFLADAGMESARAIAQMVIQKNVVLA